MRHLALISLFFFVPAMQGAPAGSGADMDGPRLLDHLHPKPQAPAEGKPANLRVDVNMALVPVTVLDSMGRNVTGLTRENFRVFDGANAVPIVAFSREDQPVSVGLVFDCSRSMADKFKDARRAVTELFKQLDERDETFLVTVAARPELRQDFTSNLPEIENALMFTQPNGTTSLVDGIYLGLTHLRAAHNPRKALIVVSDGGDNDSRYSLRELISMATEADTQIFTIGLHDNPQTLEEAEGPALLAELTHKSGGVSFTIHEPEDYTKAMAKIGVTLHNQYVLGYYPPDHAPSGKYRKIRVQLMLPSGLPRLQIYARAGYYVPGR